MENKEDSFGLATSFIFGEVTRSTLSYIDRNSGPNLAKLDLGVSSKLKYLRFSRYYLNNVVFWGKMAEEIYKKIDVRNFKKEIDGTFIFILSEKSGVYKDYRHCFVGLKYKIFSSASEFNELKNNIDIFTYFRNEKDEQPVS